MLFDYEQKDRVLAVSPRNAKFLKSLNSFEDYYPIHKMHVWSNCYSKATIFEDKEPLCYMMNTRNILTNLKIQTKAQILPKLDKIKEKTLYFGKKSLIANVVIGADGPNSMVRKAAQIETTGHKYDSIAIVAEMEMENCSCAHQRFLPTGTIALLPTSKNEASLVWIVPKSFIYDNLAEMINTVLCLKLTEVENFLLNPKKFQLDKKLPQVLNVKNVQSYPLQTMHVSKYEHQNYILMGDAAHVCSPLAGQGLNMGLRDANFIAQIINKNMELGISPDQIEYNFKRLYRINAMTLLGCDLMQQCSLPEVAFQQMGTKLMQTVMKIY